MYDHQKIEPKWAKYWLDKGLFRAPDESDKPKYYILDMFPYPSGSGLHVGHLEGYTATDIVSRYMRMKGFNVLHPMGWDAFGLPAENYAIKTKVHPKETTQKSIEVFTEQIKRVGFSYDWDREIRTCYPDYYKWTQWFFLFLYKNGLAYKKDSAVNYCESCKTTLANEQVVQGKCERCSNEVMQKNLNQWFFKITQYAEELIDGLDTIDWPESTKINQKNWIGKSEGTEVDFSIEGHDDVLKVYTTRVDTLFSGTFMVLAPEHPLVEKITTKEHKKEIEQYQKETALKNDLQRTDLNKDKKGAFTGAYAINPASGDKMPIWISDFVLVSYGSGAVFADAHDERDFEMAKKYDIPLKVSLRPDDDELWEKVEKLEVCFPDFGILVNSGQFDGLTSEEAKVKITEWLEKEGKGRKMINYKFRDWLVSRQRYWGAPIPIIYCEDCGEVPVPESDLPIALPEDVDFLPTGESPLKFSESFHNVNCPKCGKKAERESDTMDTFVCSSWYFFRFCDPKNEKAFASKEILQKLMPVDLYVGGAEHTVLHLLYSRFFTKALHAHGYIDFDEPFMKLRHQGIILGSDHEKMSKSRGNTVNPDDVIVKYGADAIKLYEMFMGPFEHSCPWDTKSIEGVYRFLNKVWTIFTEKEVVDTKPSEEIERLLHKTIKKVGKDIEEFGFNTAIAQMMIFINALMKEETLSKELRDTFIKVLSPFAPFMAEELWERAGYKESIMLSNWPEYDEALTKDNEIELVIQVNGKVREKTMVASDISKEDAIAKAKELPKIQGYLDGKEIVKEIFVPGKLVNVVIK